MNSLGVVINQFLGANIHLFILIKASGKQATKGLLHKPYRTGESRNTDGTLNGYICGCHIIFFFSLSLSLTNGLQWLVFTLSNFNIHAIPEAMCI